MSTTRSLTPGRTFLFALATPLLLFAVVEGSLRLAAEWVMASYQADITELPTEKAEELWVFGDSYTFGVGAERPATESWPAVTAELLTKQGRPTLMRNFAEPGLNSSEIVARLTRELAERAPPRHIAILAGVNNTRWLGQSGQFCLEEAAKAEGIGRALTKELDELRTYKVLRQTVLALRPLRNADIACRAVADGFQRLDDGKPDEALERFEAAVHARPMSGWAHLGVGLSKLRVARHREALVALDRASQLGVAPPALALARGFSLRLVGRGGEAEAVARATHPGDLRWFARLLTGWTLADAGESEEALSVFDELGGLKRGEHELPLGGVVPFALDARGWVLLGQGDIDAADASFSEANERGAEMYITPHLLGWSHLGRGLVAAERGDLIRAHEEFETACRDSSAAAAARAAGAWVSARAGDLHRSGELLAVSESIAPGNPLAASLRRHLASGAPPPPLSALGLLPGPTIAVQQWLDPGDTRLIESDLLQAGYLSRSVGSRLIILTYPQPKAHPELSDAHRRASEQLSVPFVDPRPTFAREFETSGNWNTLLIPDGHPTSRGYRLMAQDVVRAVQSWGIHPPSSEDGSAPPR